MLPRGNTTICRMLQIGALPKQHLQLWRKPKLHSLFHACFFLDSLCAVCLPSIQQCVLTVAIHCSNIIDSHCAYADYVLPSTGDLCHLGNSAGHLDMFWIWPQLVVVYQTCPSGTSAWHSWEMSFVNFGSRTAATYFPIKLHGCM